MIEIARLRLAPDEATSSSTPTRGRPTGVEPLAIPRIPYTASESHREPQPRYHTKNVNFMHPMDVDTESGPGEQPDSVDGPPWPMDVDEPTSRGPGADSLSAAGSNVWPVSPMDESP
jgi:hypothetical protein